MSSTPPVRCLTSVFGLLCVLGDVVLGPPVCEHQSDPGDVSASWTSALCFREAVLYHVFQGQTRHGSLFHVFNLTSDVRRVQVRAQIMTFFFRENLFHFVLPLNVCRQESLSVGNS